MCSPANIASRRSSTPAARATAMRRRSVSSVDALLRVVQDEVGALRGEAHGPLGVRGEEVAQVPRRDLVEVRRQRLPLGCGRHVHGGQSTGRAAPCAPAPRNSMMAGIAVPSCSRKRCPPSNSVNRAPRIAPARNSLLAGGARPSKRPPQTNVGQRDAPQPGRRVVLAPAPRAGWPVPDSRLRAPRPPRASALRDQGDLLGVGGAPGPVPAGVEQLHPQGGPRVVVELSRARAGGTRHRPRPPAEVQARTRRRTRRGCRIVSSWATMPPKDTPTTRQSSQPTGVEERGGVVGEIGHGGGPGRHAALPEAALVVERAVRRRRPGAVGQPRLGCAGHHAPGATPCTHRLYPRPGRSRQVRRRAPCGTQPSYSG